jgi:hypothetical protein
LSLNIIDKQNAIIHELTSKTQQKIIEQKTQRYERNVKAGFGVIASAVEGIGAFWLRKLGPRVT